MLGTNKVVVVVNEICPMPKVKFKRNNHYMLLQRPLEANEYIDLLDLNMP